MMRKHDLTPGGAQPALASVFRSRSRDCKNDSSKRVARLLAAGLVLGLCCGTPLFAVLPPAPLSPGTSSPPGQQISTTTPVFQWQESAGAKYYSLTVKQYPSGPVAFDQYVNGSSMTMSSGVLQAGNTYKWDMRAYDFVGGVSDTSATLYFTVGGAAANPPGTFTLSGSPSCWPGDSSYPAGPGVLLTWTTASGATSYELHWDGVLRKPGITDTSFWVITGLTAGQTYTWQVKAVNSYGVTVSNAVTVTAPTCGAGCVFSLSTTGKSFARSGGTGSVGVSASSGCAWTATSNAAWITITSGSGGSGSGSVNYSVAENQGASSRTGTLTIAGQTFAVTQAGAVSLTASPAALTFAAQRGGASPPAQTLQLTASDGSSIAWSATASASSGASWLSVSPAAGSTPASVLVSVSVTGLASGSYTGQLSIAVSAGTTLAVSVSLNVSDTASAIGVSPAALQFTASVGTNPGPQNLAVSNSGGGALSWFGSVSYTSGSGWLSINPPGGNAPTTAAVSVDVITPVLAPGTYRGQILIFALSGATNSPLAVPVTLLVTSPAQLAVSPQFLYFQMTQGSSAPASQAISVTNAGSGALNWAAGATTSNGGNWLTLSATQGAAPATITVSANPAGLPAGVYLGSIRFTDSATGASVPIVAALTINPPATTILLSQSDFVFTATEGSQMPLRQILRILNIGQGALPWKLLPTIPSGGRWLSLDQTSGSTTTDPSTAAPIGVLIDPFGLPAGNYYGLLIASSSGATNSPQLASVHLRVVPSSSSPVASALPSGFIFAASEGSASPPPQSFAVQNIGGGALAFRASVSTADGVPWLTVSPAQASAPATLGVQVSSGSLRAGVYRGTISLELPGGVTQGLSVLLVITPAGMTASAFHGPERPAAACVPREMHAVATGLPNNFNSLVGWPVPIVVRVIDDCNNAVADATVVASFSVTGNAPLIMKSLRDGLYTATWVPVSSQRVRVIIKAVNPPLKEATVELLAEPTAFSAALPLITPEGVVNGASFAPKSPVAPGSIVSLFGRNFASRPTQAAAPLPRTLAGLAVKIGDLNAPLFYADSGQVNAQVPMELSGNTAASVVVTLDGRVSPPESLLLSTAQPGIFSYDDGGVTRGAVLDEKFMLVGRSNPASRGGVIQVFATGLGPTNPPLRTGEPAPSDPVAVLAPETQLAASVGGIAGEIQFKGLAPGFVGLYQVNITVPAGLAPGDHPLVLTANGLRSNEVMLAVK